MEDADLLGVATALQRTCTLEAKLRQAIQASNPLSCSFDRDPLASDRERQALLDISEGLEALEDKLREYKSLGPLAFEDKTITLSQIDSMRRELIETVRRGMEHVFFGKDVVKEVLSFAEMQAPEEEQAEQKPGVLRQHNHQHSSPTSGRSKGSALFEPGATKASKTIYSPTGVENGFIPPSPDSPKQQTRRELWQGRSPLRGTVEEADRIIYHSTRSGDADSLHAPAAMLSPGRVRDEALYSTTNGTSRYRYDPAYGGMVSLAAFREEGPSAPEPFANLPIPEPVRRGPSMDDWFASSDRRASEDGASDASRRTTSTSARADPAGPPAHKLVLQPIRRQHINTEPSGGKTSEPPGKRAGFGAMGAFVRSAAVGLVAGAAVAGVVAGLDMASSEGAHRRAPPKKKAVKQAPVSWRAVPEQAESPAAVPAKREKTSSADFNPPLPRPSLLYPALPPPDVHQGQR